MKNIPDFHKTGLFSITHTLLNSLDIETFSIQVFHPA